MTATWMIYGANGYTGELAAREAAHHRLFGHRIPGTARLAPPDPLRVFVAALGAAVDRFALRHGARREGGQAGRRYVHEPASGEPGTCDTADQSVSGNEVSG